MEEIMELLNELADTDGMFDKALSFANAKEDVAEEGKFAFATGAYQSMVGRRVREVINKLEKGCANAESKAE